jgi:hypothetical protein
MCIIHCYKTCYMSCPSYPDLTTEVQLCLFLDEKWSLTCHIWHPPKKAVSVHLNSITDISTNIKSPVSMKLCTNSMTIEVTPAFLWDVLLWNGGDSMCSFCFIRSVTARWARHIEFTIKVTDAYTLQENLIINKQANTRIIAWLASFNETAHHSSHLMLIFNTSS